MPLSLVTKTAPDDTERIRQRVKAFVRPDGMLQCNRCGGRSAVTAINGATVKNGRVQGGTVTDKLVCDECRKQGVIVPMLPELKKIE